MDDVKVSVCMVTYNQERYIAQAVDSVLAQRTTFPIEIVIGEDCSTDRTRSILLELARRNPEKIRLRLAERNQGGKANFIDTVTACRGQYVAMLEGDDYWTCPEKLQLQVEALDAHPDWAICFHPTQCVYEGGMQGQAIYPLDWDRAEATLLDLFKANFIPTNSAVFRNRLFGAFPPWFRELLLGDWPLHMLNAAHGNIGFLPDVMSAYRIHRGGLWSGEQPAVRMVAIFQMFTAIDHHFGGKYAEAIDRYRLNAVRDLMAEIDAAKNSHQQIALGCNPLADELALLKENYHALTEEHRRLKAFYDSWSRSIAYRVVRETRRLVKQLWQGVRRLLGSPENRQSPAAPSISKAA